MLIYLDLLEATMGAILIVNTIDKKMLQFVVVVVLKILFIYWKKEKEKGDSLFFFFLPLGKCTAL